MRILYVLPVCAAITLAACAKRPNAISPATIPSSAYANLKCDALQAELRSEKEKLTVMSTAQNSAATADAVGVFLVGIPAASLTGGDQEGNIAVSKGKIVAMEAEVTAKSC